jgi:hypothetical protein
MASNHEIDASLYQVARCALDHALQASAADRQWSIRNIDNAKDIKQSNSILITISSFRFRVFCFLHVNLDQTTRQFVAEATHAKLQDVDENALLDYLLELSNSMTGNVKRFIQSTCPPLGMSTPNLLSKGCMLFDDVLHSQHTTHLVAYCDGSNQPLFGMTCMINLQKDDGFLLPASRDLEPEIELDSSGGLELF